MPGQIRSSVSKQWTRFLRISSRTVSTGRPLFFSSPTVFASFTPVCLPYVEILPFCCVPRHSALPFPVGLELLLQRCDFPFSFPQGPSQRPFVDDKPHPCQENAEKHRKQHEEKDRHRRSLQPEIIPEDDPPRILHGEGDAQDKKQSEANRLGDLTHASDPKNL